MARTPAPDLLSKLVDRGEEALQRFTDAPAAHKLFETVTTLRGRVDELQKRVRGIDALERRVAALEKKVAALSKKPAAPARKPSTKKT